MSTRSNYSAMFSIDVMSFERSDKSEIASEEALTLSTFAPIRGVLLFRGPSLRAVTARKPLRASSAVLQLAPMQISAREKLAGSTWRKLFALAAVISLAPHAQRSAPLAGLTLF